ncbi:hypothetical protein KI387_028906, partial [Taxus chinensis]
KNVGKLSSFEGQDYWKLWKAAGRTLKILMSRSKEAQVWIHIVVDAHCPIGKTVRYADISVCIEVEQ